MSSSKFTSLVLSPAALPGSDLAIEAARAGGVGLLDTEFALPAGLDQALNNLELLLQHTSSTAVVGLRIRADQMQAVSPLVAKLTHRPHWIILCRWRSDALVETLRALPAASQRRLLLEVIDPDELRGIEEAAPAFDGLVARGSESGGWVGELPAFILAQKLLQTQPQKVYVQGGIGVHAAAACRAVGASGVVLDSQLLLLPNSPLPEAAQGYLKRLGGQEATLIGERLGVACRVLWRPGFAAVDRLKQMADQIEVAHEVPADHWEEWQTQADDYLSWHFDPAQKALPLGQAVGMAAAVRDRYRTVTGLLEAIQTASEQQVRSAQRLQPLAPDAPLAVSHGTRYPIVQGPMTRVSDVAEFAHAVAEAGALPMLALALMRRPQVEQLLTQAQKLLANRSWGVGILGFVPHALREAQLEVIRAVKPPFALIAGGRPDQAASLEAEGIATYIHVPTPSLLKLFLDQGARRFVFEGRECGGHVGPLSSFVLWDSAIATLLAEVADQDAAQIHVLFAGGIHDRTSAAMVATMAAPLAARGMKVGVLMGTAYILTQEAVDCGAVVPAFQQEILKCQKTINLETGPGHASRCAMTAFAHEFYQKRRQMLADQCSAESIKATLEDMTLGRLRVASKGVTRDAAGQLVTVAADQQIADGMYMIGQVATLRHQTFRAIDLHQDVALGSTQLLSSSTAAAPAAAAAQPFTPGPSEVAIVGISTLLPKATDHSTFWRNIVQQVDCITEIPANRWDWRLYYDADRRTRDKIYSKWGGFLEDVPFDPLRFGIPPKSLKSIDPMQLLALEGVRRALADADYSDGNFDRENTSVIIGCGGGIGELGQQYGTRTELPRFVGTPPAEAWDRLPEWTEESFAGIILNVTAGRVANRFDLGGSNFTVDAACASSLAAVDLAVRELESGRANVAIAGGVDTVQSPFAFFCFSKTQALSSRGRCHSFDQSADGICISEGLAFVVLKRLADAERDGDRIYGVIKAVASSSDGKALGMTAPLPAGQQRAVRRAFTQAGFAPSTVSLYEAHGTGTAAGDRAELETWLATLQGHAAAPKSCAIGSVKTSIGHTKGCAGLAGLIKVALSLHHKVLPPHMNVQQPLEPITRADSPVYLLNQPHPWLASPHHPRRGAVSAFGFGGTNFHAVLEEYQGTPTTLAPGGDTWPCELMVLRAADRPALVATAQQLLSDLEAGAAPQLGDLAYTYAKVAAAHPTRAHCLVMVVTSLTQLQESLAVALSHLSGPVEPPLPRHIRLSDQATTQERPIAFLFPGQGSQYPWMARELAIYCQELRQRLEFADRHLQDTFPQALSTYIFPPSVYSEEAEIAAENQLRQTQITQPALAALEMGLLDLAHRLGLQETMVAGHSFGEYTALYAGGVLTPGDFLTLAQLRGQVTAAAAGQHQGTMAAVQLPRDTLETCLRDETGVAIANHNAPHQSVISGDEAAVRRIVQRLTEQDIKARVLAVTGAFHTPMMAQAVQPLAAAIQQTPVQAPQIPVYSNTSASPYPQDPAAIQQQLAQHLLSPVEFVHQIEQMYAHGARVFLELGPKSVLTKLARQILADKDCVVAAFDGSGGGLQGFLLTLGELMAAGVPYDLTALFAGRSVQELDLQNLVATTQSAPPSPTTWLINGGNIRSQTDAVGRTGKLPQLRLDTLEQSLTPVAAAPLRGSTGGTPGSSQPRSQGEGRRPLAAPAEPPLSGPPTVASAIAASPPLPSAASPSSKGALPLAFSGSSVPYRSQSMENTASPPPSAPLGQPARNGWHTKGAPAPVPADSGTALTAYLAYQETMRLFLQVEEQVMHQFLQGAGLLTPSSTNPQWPQRSGLSTPPGGSPSAMPPPPAPVAPPGEHDWPVTAIAPPPAAAEVKPPAPPMPVATPVSASPAPAPTPVATAPAPASQPTALDREKLCLTLLELVSERTGYPVNMLGLDQDVEAELGIDSIKRVEILGALQKVLPEELAEPLNQQMERLIRVKTFNGILDALLDSPSPTGVGAAPPPAPPPAEVVAPATPATPGLDRASLQHDLVQLVADRTGYPDSMLGLDQDLEAELGIDSIKRVEILGALQKMLPPSIAEQVSQRMEQLTRVKTLNGLLDKLLTQATAGEAASLGKLDGGSLHPPLTTAAPAVMAVPRFVMKAVRQPLISSPPERLTGLFLITADPYSCCVEVAQQLAQRGAQTALLHPSMLTDRTATAAIVEQLRQQHGAITGIIHLASLAARALPASLTGWHERAQLEVKSLFDLLQLCQADLLQANRHRQGHVIAATLLDGQFNRTGTGAGLPLGGGNVGLLKTLKQEWVGINAKALDFDRDLSPLAIAEQIVQELVPTEEVEVGYPGGDRTCWHTQPAPLQPDLPPRLLPQADWVVLVTGGARGITAEVTTQLLQAGMRLILVGRSPRPGPEAAETAALTEVNPLRQAVIRQAQQAGQRPTPVEVERRLQRILADRTIRQHLAAYEQAGVTVEYHSVDVRDPDSFGALIDRTYECYGRIDAVIHGAGVIEDKLLVDKTPDSFARVFETKVDSLYLLARHLRPESLKLLAFFTSVAGRYGNPGQGDYAVANEVVNRMAWGLQTRWPQTRVVAINWGPWDTAGMASEAVKRQFRERQIIPIPLVAGCQFFLDELRYGSPEAVEVVAGQGPWAELTATGQPDLAAVPDQPSGGEASPSPGLPLLRQPPELQPNGSVVLRHQLTVQQDPYLGDHRLDGQPVLPAAGALEWFAECVQAAWPDWVVYAVQDLRVLRGLVLDRPEGKAIEIRARASTHADPTSLEVMADLLDPATGLAYYRATLSLRQQLPAPPRLEIAPLLQGQPLASSTAYDNYLFHGDCFQLVQTISRLGPAGVDAQVTPSSPRVWTGRPGHWLFDPGVIDTAPQLAIAWGRVERQTTPLPSRFGAVKRFRSTPSDQPLQVALRLRQVSDLAIAYDAVFYDAAGQVHWQLEDIEGTCNPQLNRLAHQAALL